MRPELDEVLLVPKPPQIALTYPLENLSNVPQIICVMAFSGGGKQVASYIVIQVDRCRHELISRRLDLLRHLSREVHKDPLNSQPENPIKGLVLKWLSVKQVVVPQVPESNRIAACRRGQHSSGKHDVLKELELLRVQVVPTLSVHPLTKKLDRRLRPVTLLLRHVQIVDKNDAKLLPLLRTEVSLPPPRVNLALNHPLKRVRSGLARERRLQIREVLGEVKAVDLANQIDRLASPSGPCKQKVHPRPDAKMQEISVPYKIARGNNKLVKKPLLRN